MFLTTIGFSNKSMTKLSTRIKVIIYDVKERMTNTVSPKCILLPIHMNISFQTTSTKKCTCPMWVISRFYLPWTSGQASLTCPATLVRPVGPSPTAETVAGPFLPYYGNPYPALPSSSSTVWILRWCSWLYATRLQCSRATMLWLLRTPQW